jgi:hypothetical protein
VSKVSKPSCFEGLFPPCAACEEKDERIAKLEADYRDLCRALGYCNESPEHGPGYEIPSVTELVGLLQQERDAAEVMEDQARGWAKRWKLLASSLFERRQLWKGHAEANESELRLCYKALRNIAAAPDSATVAELRAKARDALE